MTNSITKTCTYNAQATRKYPVQSQHTFMQSDTFFSNVIIKSAFKEYITITKGLVLPIMMSFDTV